MDQHHFSFNKRKNNTNKENTKNITNKQNITTIIINGICKNIINIFNWICCIIKCYKLIRWSNMIIINWCNSINSSISSNTWCRSSIQWYIILNWISKCIISRMIKWIRWISNWFSIFSNWSIIIRCIININLYIIASIGPSFNGILSALAGIILALTGTFLFVNGHQ